MTELHRAANNADELLLTLFWRMILNRFEKLCLGFRAKLATKTHAPGEHTVAFHPPRLDAFHPPRVVRELSFFCSPVSKPPPNRFRQLGEFPKSGHLL